MSDTLSTKIAELKANIAKSEGGHRALLSAQLHRTVADRDAETGVSKPCAERDVEDALEDMFDNLPV